MNVPLPTSSASKQREGDSRVHRRLQHHTGQLPLGLKANTLRHSGLPSAFPVISPHLGQVHFLVQQGLLLLEPAQAKNTPI